MAALAREGLVAREGRPALSRSGDVVVIDRESRLSRPVAVAEGTTEVLRTLQEAGVEAVLLAVESPAEPSQLPDRWHVLRPVAQLSPLARWVNDKTVPAGGPEPTGWRRWVAARLLSSGVTVSADGRPAAEAMARLLRPGARVVAAGALQSPAATRGPQMDAIERVAYPLLLVTAFCIGFFGAASPAWSLGVGVAVAISALVIAGSRGTRRARLGRMGRTLLVCGLCAALARGYMQVFPEPGRTTRQLAVSVAVLLVALGVVIEWRSRRIGASAAWLAPLALTLLGGLIVSLGTVAYWAYASELGLPYGALGGDTPARAVVGIVPAALAAAVPLAVLGFYGLFRWMAGSAVVSSSMISLTALLGLCMAFLQALGDGSDAADRLAAASTARNVDLPYFSVIEPVWVCASLASDDAAVEGGGLDDDRPWVLLGDHDGRYVLWRSADEHRRVSVDALNTRPADPTTGCG